MKGRDYVWELRNEIEALKSIPMMMRLAHIMGVVEKLLEALEALQADIEKLKMRGDM